jgi:competence protein ComEC
MQSHLLLFSGGVLSASLLPTLPSLPITIVLVLLCLLFTMAVSRAWFFYTLAVSSGLLWGIAYGVINMSAMLPQVMEGKDVMLQGEVCRLPGVQQNHQHLVQRFVLCVKTAREIETGMLLPVNFSQVLLSWYDGETIVPGQQWQLVARMKRPRSFVNPVGFDYQLWLMRMGIDATGYIRQGKKSQVLKDSSSGLSVAHLRYRLRQKLVNPKVDLRNHDIMAALIVGDKNQLDKSRWQLFTQTGTNHLMVISGLHIGLVALLVFWLLSGLARLLVMPLYFMPAAFYGAVAAVMAAFAYSALAGFSLPTVRACIMVVAIMLGTLSGRMIPPTLALALALFGVLLNDPLAGHAMGFWFSFAAVAVLLMISVPRPGRQKRWRRWAYPQLAVFLILIPFLAMSLGQIALLSPLANLVAIPLMSFFAVPLCLLGGGLLMVNEQMGIVVLKGADQVLDLLLWLLESLARALPESIQTVATGSYLVIVLALSGALLLLAPRGWPARYLGLFLCVPLLWPIAPKQFLLRMTVLDVGQGLAILLETAHHSLLYDAGPRYSDRFDAGSGIIAPVLRARQIRYLDRLVLSHGDADHIGGVNGLLDSVPVIDIVAGEPARQPGLANCHNNDSWVWDGVRFEFLHPPDDYRGKANNQSCVLRVQVADIGFILPGDIEAAAEYSLLSANPDLAQADVLIAPHHGSKTSSSPALISNLAPRYVVFSAAYRSRFNHPNPHVVERYGNRGVEMFNTATAGAVEFVVDEQGYLATPVLERQRKQRYWLW